MKQISAVRLRGEQVNCLDKQRHENELKTISYTVQECIYKYTLRSSKLCTVCVFQWRWSILADTPPVFSPQAASLPMSIIIVGVGPAEFDGKCVRVCWGVGRIAIHVDG